jgi:hypothetical protein
MIQHLLSENNINITKTPIMDTLSVDTKLLKEIPHDERIAVWRCLLMIELLINLIKISNKLKDLDHK